METKKTVVLPSAIDLMKEAKELIHKRLGLFLSLAALPAVLKLIVGLINSYAQSLGPIAFLILLLAMIANIFVSVALILALDKSGIKDLNAALSATRGKVLSFFWVAILVSIVTMIGFALLIIPGIYLAVLFAFASFFVVLHDVKGWEAANKSKQLVQGDWWTIFGRFFVFFLIVAVIYMLIIAVLNVIGIDLLINLATFGIELYLAPFVMAFSYVFYKKLMKKKGLTIAKPKKKTA